MLNFHKIAIKFLQKSVLEDPKTWITFPQKGYSLLWSFRRISCSCVLKEIKNCVERNCIVCNSAQFRRWNRKRAAGKIKTKKHKRFSWVYFTTNTVGFPSQLSKYISLDSWFLSKRNLTRKWAASCFENNFHYDLRLERSLACFLKHFSSFKFMKTSISYNWDKTLTGSS